MFSGCWLHGNHVKREDLTQEQKNEVLSNIIKKKGYANHSKKEEKEYMDENTNVFECQKGFNTAEAVVEGFNADDVCMNCPSIVYKDGVISCKYAKVN